VSESKCFGKESLKQVMTRTGKMKNEATQQPEDMDKQPQTWPDLELVENGVRERRPVRNLIRGDSLRRKLSGVVFEESSLKEEQKEKRGGKCEFSEPSKILERRSRAIVRISTSE